MRVLVVLHDHVSAPGSVGEGFASRGYEVEQFLVVPPARFATPRVEVTFPDPTSYDAIVSLGAPWSVYDHGIVGSWLPGELAMLRRADEHGVPVLGICFGGQALAAALGGHVEPAPEPEIGWIRVHSADESTVESGPWFQWHSDRWVAPADAVELARTRVAPQAFVVRRNLAVQFHPEITPSALEDWLEHGGASYLVDRGHDPAALLAQTRRLAKPAARRGARLVDRFLSRVAARHRGTVAGHP